MPELTKADFQVGYQSQTILLEQWDLHSTVQQVKEYLEETTSIPIDAQKLLWKGKILKDNNIQLKDLPSVSPTTNRMLLMGSPQKAIEKVNSMDKKLMEQRKIVPMIRMKKQQQPKPVKEMKYTFHKISVIEEFPHPERARKILERLRDDRGIQAIMKARKWSVGELIELTPFEASILGYNRNAGQLIALRLRTDDLSGFRHYDSIRKVLLHELTHNVWGEHDDNFHALNRQLNKDVVALDWTAHGGHSLGNGSYYNPEEEEVMDDVGYEAGTYRLGGSSVAALDNDPEARRQLLARATLSRLTKQEEKEMDEGCGSA
ncbi:hypothetical protein G6F70_004084 [Rhizopus microsporus]|nr:hypothetical protein G6F71_004105 [Rhizopus microsporus]KAG1200397.1 hypothetical protein G6F70_004084 [Rhizopus microsporus]KAG1212629.1 hypothetical protein G6F69_003524 [Rhizopus microsporus]KAG1234559.1 hypothetical protein G6F67_003422 [Rhizopus microsporus]KAG1263309.1 hypothetical protein G6F68_005246 [Rhizopus microsporus]